MKLQDLIECKPHKNLFGKSTGEFRAVGLGAEAYGKTKDEAIQNLVSHVTRCVENCGKLNYAYSKDGKTVFVHYYLYNSWGYDIMSPGQNHPCSTSGGEHATHKEKSLELMRQHAANYEDY